MYGLLLVMLLQAQCLFVESQKENGLPKWDDEDIFVRLLNHYKNSKLPRRPSEVKLGVHIVSIYGFSFTNMDYSLSFYLRMSWTDPRLRYEADNQEHRLRLPHGYWDNIWTPDLFVRNEKTARYIDIIAPQRLLTISPTGEVLYVTKYGATLSCPMNLRRFPFDTQMCRMTFESFGYTMDDMYFGWRDKPFDVDPAARMSEFTLIDAILYDCSQNYSGGTYPCLEIRLVMQRDIGYYILQVFVPSIMLVMMSWTQFWLEPRPMTSRVLVGLFCSFTLVAQMTGLRSSLPSISYMTSLDAWMVVCLVFTASTLLQLMLVAVCAKRQGRKSEDESDTIPEMIDVVARICFPLLFLVFSVTYFCIMLIARNSIE